MRNKQPNGKLVSIMILIYTLILIIQSIASNYSLREGYFSGAGNGNADVKPIQTSTDLMGTIDLGVMLAMLFFIAFVMMLTAVVIRKRLDRSKISGSPFSEEIQEAYAIDIIRPTLSIIGLLRKKRLQSLHGAGISLSVAIVAYQILLGYRIVEASIIVSSVLFLLLAVVVIHILSFDFRVGSGLYGNNASEAIDVIRFIQQESQIDNSTGGGASRNLYVDEDLKVVLKPIARPIR